jgi:hypothetical protein
MNEGDGLRELYIDVEEVYAHLHVQDDVGAAVTEAHAGDGLPTRGAVTLPAREYTVGLAAEAPQVVAMVTGSHTVLAVRVRVIIVELIRTCAVHESVVTCTQITVGGCGHAVDAAVGAHLTDFIHSVVIVVGVTHTLLRYVVHSEGYNGVAGHAVIRARLTCHAIMITLLAYLRHIEVVVALTTVALRCSAHGGVIAAHTIQGIDATLRAPE